MAYECKCWGSRRLFLGGLENQHTYDTLEDRCKKTICLTAALHITHASKYTSINCPQHTCSPNACMILWKMSTHSYTLFAMSKTKKTVCIYIYACMHIIYTYTYTNTYVQMHILYLPSLACSCNSTSDSK